MQLSTRLLAVVLAATLTLGTTAGATWASPSPSDTGPTSAAAQSAEAGPLFGASVWRESGQSYADALASWDATFGGMQITRVFYSGLPAPWPGIAGASGRPIVVSFWAPPSDILAGSHDGQLREWFASAPTDRPIWWAYIHEPEDDIAAGQYTAADFRAAFAHVDALADAAGGPNLHSTLILMCWSLAAESGRQWLDYYPGDTVVDVLGWDCYNNAWRQGRYKTAADMFSSVVAAAGSVGKPWGIAEFGSIIVQGDDGSGRAQWLRECAAWLREAGATWATYFNSKLDVDFRLLDAPSAAAWREVVSGSPPPADAPPTVGIDAPADGSLVDATFEVTASARDDGAVSDLVLYIDGESRGGFPDLIAGSSVTASRSVTLPVGQHTLRVQAVDNAQPAAQSATSDPVTVTVDGEDPCPAGPTAPTDLHSTGSDYTSVSMAWADPNDPNTCPVREYRVYRDTHLVGQVTGTSFVDTDLDAGRSYQYAVAAVDASARLSDRSGEVQIATAADDLAPTPPAEVTAQPAADAPRTRVDLNWTGSRDQPDPGGGGVDGYLVYRVGATEPLVRLPATARSYSDAGLAPGTTYAYQVTAVDVVGNESTPSAEAAATTAPDSTADTTAPTAPGSVAARALQPSRVSLTWTASTDAGSGLAGYRIFRSDRSTALRVLSDPTAVAFVDTTTKADTYYTYRVQAFDRRGNSSPATASNRIRTPKLGDETRPTQPQQLRATSITARSVTLTWKAVTDRGGSGLAGYHVYRGSRWIGDSAGTATTFTDSGLQPRTAYSYSVVAYDRAANNSLRSATLRVTTRAAGATGSPLP